MNLQERKKRIIARGEYSDHCHVVTGDALIKEEKGNTYIEVGKEGAFLKHILESRWLQGEEVWSDEHEEIQLPEGRYQYIAQEEFDPYEKTIRRIKD